MKRTWLALQGPKGFRSKAPAVTGWESPGFVGIADPETAYDPEDFWIGMRTDGLVVIDCDSEAAAAEWVLRTGQSGALHTWVRKSPRGYHFIYSAVPGAPDGPSVDVFPGVDIRAGRPSQIVYYAPGYHDLSDETRLSAFDPSWLEGARVTASGNTGSEDEWSEMPEGRGNNTMTAIAGALRKQGMDLTTMYRTLLHINKITMTSDPMPSEMIRGIAQSVARYEPDPTTEVELGEGWDEEDGEELVTEEPEWSDSNTMKLRKPAGWLWRPYFPKGRLVMLDGREGKGKGMLCAYLAKQVVSGGEMPCGTETEPGNVIWLSAEDDPYDDLLVRLTGADIDHGTGYRVTFRSPSKPWGFPNDIKKLEKRIKETGAKLIILDPGRAFLVPPKGVEMSYNSDAAMRPGLQELIALAHRLKVTILFVHHWNKSALSEVADRSGGSGAFAQTVRLRVSVAAVGGRWAMSVEKTNIGSQHYTVRLYELEQVVFERDGITFETAKFVPGPAEPEYSGLDEWIDTMKKLDGQSELIFNSEWDDIAEEYAYLVRDSLAPTVEQIMKDHGLEQDEAARIRLDWVNHEVITAKGRWLGPPKSALPEPGAAEAWLRETGNADDAE